METFNKTSERTKKVDSNAKRVAVYPGSFDPITLGHVDIIRRIHRIFEEVIVLVAQSSEKQYMFNYEERKKLVHNCFPDIPKLRIEAFDGLTVTFLRQCGAGIIVRGLRTVSDFDSESAMAQMNRHLYPDVETLLVFASHEYQAVSSRIVKEVAILGGSLKGIVPEPVERAMLEKLAQRR